MEELNFYNRHYITVDEENRITGGWSDGPHPNRDTADAICMNAQGGYQFRLKFADGLSEENPALMEWEHMIALYRWDGEYAVKRSTEELVNEKAAKLLPQLRAAKEAELSAACNAAIVAGMDVETSMGTEHFSLQETDQINLTTAINAVQTGAEEYPYHADGALCRMFSAAEIMAIADAATRHKLYHTTLCNHLLTWARRADTSEEIEIITYSAENLPDDLAGNMASLFASAAGV